MIQHQQERGCFVSCRQWCSNRHEAGPAAFTGWSPPLPLLQRIVWRQFPRKILLVVRFGRKITFTYACFSSGYKCGSIGLTVISMKYAKDHTAQKTTAQKEMQGNKISAMHQSLLTFKGICRSHIHMPSIYRLGWIYVYVCVCVHFVSYFKYILSCWFSF